MSCKSTSISPSWGKFQESIAHCRWKTVLKTHVLSNESLQPHNMVSYKTQTFHQIFSHVLSICSDVKGIGLLAVYDITADICKFNGILIDKVYIIGNGPKRAIKLLNIPNKTHKIGKVNLKYVDIPEIKSALNKHGYVIPFESNNADDYESFICNWQKNIK